MSRVCDRPSVVTPFGVSRRDAKTRRGRGESPVLGCEEYFSAVGFASIVMVVVASSNRSRMLTGFDTSVVRPLAGWRITTEIFLYMLGRCHQSRMTGSCRTRPQTLRFGGSCRWSSFRTSWRMRSCISAGATSTRKTTRRTEFRATSTFLGSRGLRRGYPDDERTLDAQQGSNRLFTEMYYLSCWNLYRPEHEMQMWQEYAPEGVAVNDVWATSGGGGHFSRPDPETICSRPYSQSGRNSDGRMRCGSRYGGPTPKAGRHGITTRTMCHIARR